ncbi:G-protein beta WD-40 repeat-containing protein [Cynara cardunculus var. scolymus]|uniref:G-protein beta WD-40 repeat-containing protein n=1 Tax=Cynara cardunculus var. scolymus TaxID=59895 RepID=A0A103YMZ8_CYNCS|nr:G-protein beta WD-40 repeat-containing protein [Cynara cardunculus var. scolymus]
MEVRRTMTMNWDELGDLDDDDDIFFDAQRLSSVLPQDLAYSSDEDDDEVFDDCRMSFSSSSAPAAVSRNYSNSAFAPEFQTNEYDMWMAAPDQSINDRRRRLLQDMGIGASNRDFLGLGNAPSRRMPSRRIDVVPPMKPVEKQPSPHSVEQKYDEQQQRLLPAEQLQQQNLPSRPLLDRSRSDVAISTSIKHREEEMIGSIEKQRLSRTSSGFSMPFAGLSTGRQRMPSEDVGHTSDDNYGTASDGQTESLFMIHNMDNGNKFEVKECNNQGKWNKLRDVQTGEHVTMEEFEKNAGHSPKVKEGMKRAVNDGKHGSGHRKLTPAGNSSFKKSFKKSKKKGASFLKNIKGSMGGSKTDQKEKDATVTTSPSINSNNPPSISEQKPSSQWVKARVHGKSYKEFTALHLSQEIKGHDGSIWAIKFTYDGHYLATAGEDKVIHIWEVQEFDVSNQGGDDSSSAAGTPVHPMALVAGSDGRPPLPEATPEKKKKGKKKKGIPDYVHVPETVFGLSETPFCTLEGHMEDILDLSWSRSQLLLSSSMDKTVRLWDIETKNCLKLFSHTDFVTCIQFNPADDDYFISGSLDAKVRIWNIPERQVVDWIDLHEMVTAIGYSNDGKEQIELKTKKKPQPKKITGFQFSAWNPSELLVTSADSRVRILDGTKIVQKFKGYKNNNSQFSADYSPDGKYVISASEDSQVYVWRHEGSRGKNKHTIIKTYEHFPCKEVSVTAPWPGSSRIDPPVVAMHSKRHSKRSTTTLPPTATAAGSISPLHDDTGHGKRAASLPPLPKRSGESINEDLDHHSSTDSSVGPSESFNSAASSPGRFDDVTGSSPNHPSPSRHEGGGGHGHKTIQATAWGLVIVTGGLGGEIRDDSIGSGYF